MTQDVVKIMDLALQIADITNPNFSKNMSIYDAERIKTVLVNEINQIAIEYELNK